jgi:D-proline reductase (dithiol) PrdB
MPMSRRCIPYTPRRRELNETVFALVTTAGVHLRDQEPFDLAGDNSWRLIPGDVESKRLMVTHGHYDHRHADTDINCVFPIDRLRELADEGVIADAVLLTAGCPLCHRTVVAIQREIEMLGLPTILITLVPKVSREMGPPRAIAPVGFTLGDCLGPPHQPAMQRRVLLDALRRWEAREEPGAIWEISYPDYTPDPVILHGGEIIEEK